MKVNSNLERRGELEKITQGKSCFVLTLERQKSIQTQQQSHHGLTVPQPRGTWRILRNQYTPGFCFSSNLLLLMSFLHIWPNTWKQTL